LSCPKMVIKMELEEIRRQIDNIDRQLLVLLQERMSYALRAGKFKQQVSDPEREQDILERAARLRLDLVERSFARQLLEAIFAESKRLQRQDRTLVAFQGEHGAYGEVAARKLVPEGAYIPCLEFGDVFGGVAKGHFDLGVVPVENSLEGAVTRVDELLTRTELKIVGEISVPVDHCLLAVDADDISRVRLVYSHPQALARCRNFLSRHGLEQRPFYDTAGAAKMLARDNPGAAAAVASRLCADLYGLKILAEKIQDGPSNSTRFILLSTEACQVESGKTSIVFSTTHTAGSLFKVLRLFAEAGINLTRISSIPGRTDPGSWDFFLDFEGSVKQAEIAAVMDRVKKVAVDLRWLGSYPADPKLV